MAGWSIAALNVEIRCPRCNGRASVESPYEYHRARKVLRNPQELPTTSGTVWRWQSLTDPERGTYWLLLRADAPDLSEVRAHVWGTGALVEKYPSVVHWLPEWLERQYSYDPNSRVVIKCRKCHLIAPHHLIWPDDAYFKWDIRGHTLWALHEEHAKVLLQFIASAKRDETQFPEYASTLRKLPGNIISAKVRDLVVSKITSTLKTEGALEDSALR